MTDDEWASFATELEYAFKGDLDEPTEAVYRRYFGEWSYDEGRATIELLIERGHLWLPLPGELKVAHQSIVSPPSPPWAEAWPVIRMLIQRTQTPQGLVSAVGRELGEGAARFVQQYGADRLRIEPTDDPAHGGAVLNRLGKDYDASVAAAVEDGRVGRALDAVNRSALGEGREGLRRAVAPVPDRRSLSDGGS